MQPTRMDDFPHVFIQLPDIQLQDARKTRKCHRWACHDISCGTNLLADWFAKGIHMPHLCLESALEVPRKDRLNLRHPDSKSCLRAPANAHLLQVIMYQFCTTKSKCVFLLIAFLQSISFIFLRERVWEKTELQNWKGVTSKCYHGHDA